MSESMDARLARLETRLDALGGQLLSIDEKLDDVRSNQLPALKSDIASLKTKNALIGAFVGGVSGLAFTAALELLIKLAG